MPKNKTHSGAKKRFRLTGSGKVMRERAHHVHKFEERAKRQTRRLVPDVVVAKADEKKIKRLLGK
ncbi:50S ribosomal protein L35 [Arsenicicoccus cauae]|uniref:Large ribosomal subunit protein bL35 n=2 Tax=Arsenicicoccus TaxID=267408 RepID=A0A6I3IDG1_9MICO|nr:MULTISPECIES: 50S ribosomal protein L35 [Arsenicicoccus]AKT51665.1 50S ribosomal protein L35 [Arsenicicoccus sp. oral taxon 190]MCG7323197.1 50S ribosomal protein L35 [Arsenicicoccus bolidensis]MCH8613198.1 50S ribosomal protein L35 [Arsenicicoccus dermatophilus]MTB71757.1 50S ribosomal protein L35 [Arsenicicoccus cauae]